MKSSFSTALLTASLLTAAFSISQSISAQQEDQIKDLLACDKISNPADKLECFNAVIEILKRQEEAKARSGQSADSDLMRRRSAETASPRGSDFGLSADDIRRREERANPDAARTPKEQVFNFTHHWRDAAGKYYFLMSNGQIWKEVKGSHLTVPKRAKTIRIKRNVMGGYAAFIQGVNGKKGRVKRLR